MAAGATLNLLIFCSGSFLIHQLILGQVFGVPLIIITTTIEGANPTIQVENCNHFIVSL